MFKLPPRIGVRVLLGLLCLILSGWASLAIYYSLLPEDWRLSGVVLYCVLSLVVLICIRSRFLAWMVYGFLFTIVLVGWLSMVPSNSRDWQPDVERPAWAEINGDLVTVHDIRNCDYRTETDYTVHHYDRTYDLSKLNSIDLYTVDWGLKYMVHTMVSFGFDNGQYLCISIETRKEAGEGYSTVRGFFRQYEIYYVVADERDVVRLRTNYRVNETVRLYRIHGVSPEVKRSIFLSYIKTVNSLKTTPEWYNALTANCTTSIRRHVNPYTENSTLDWRLLINGYLDQLLYNNRRLITTLDLEDIRERSIINERALKAGDSLNFSQLIREGLPGMKNTPVLPK